MVKQHRRANKPPRNKALEDWGREITREQIREDIIAGLKQEPDPFVTWARESIKNREEKMAADRVPRFDSSGRWPMNDYVLGAALLLIGVIVLIAIAVFTGLVKP
jgi:hypothetical protein